jgi:pimeloyl-ACP methyl ester carboxylesterase
VTPSDAFVEANGTRLHYLEWGDAGPPAVLLHATGFLARLWQPIAEALSDGYHVYAYDARGHGDSDKPPDGYTWDHLADDFRALLDALGLRGVLAVGHSMGGATAAYLAATAPEYVSAAVLIEPIIFPAVREEAGDQRRNELSSGAAKRRMVWASQEALIRSYRKRRTFADWREDVLSLYAEHGTFSREDGQIELKCPGKIEAQLYENNLSLDTWNLLSDIRCRALVLRGERTDGPLALAAQGVAQRIPDARLVTMAGAGHLAPMERPEAVVDEITTFLDEGGPK